MEMNNLIREWYMSEYSDDDFADKFLNAKATFAGLNDTLDKGENVYDFLLFKNGDSLVRERCFEKLAKIMKVEYDIIYQKWLTI